MDVGLSLANGERDEPMVGGFGGNGSLYRGYLIYGWPGI